MIFYFFVLHSDSILLNDFYEINWNVWKKYFYSVKFSNLTDSLMLWWAALCVRF